uniref:Uncharacterized protein n=1 Tax=Rhizophora mucronata TaxID=61149 RepID=A0A2P2PW33_RHIMU
MTAIYIYIQHNFRLMVEVCKFADICREMQQHFTRKFIKQTKHV